MHRAARPEQLSSWAVVDVACRIVSKVASQEVPSSRFDLSNTRIRGRCPSSTSRFSIGAPYKGIGRKPIRLETKAFFRSRNHSHAKPFTANQVGCDANFDDTLEHAAKNIAPAGNAHCGHAKMPNDPGKRPRYQACRTSDRRGTCISLQVDRASTPAPRPCLLASAIDPIPQDRYCQED